MWPFKKGSLLSYCKILLYCKFSNWHPPTSSQVKGFWAGFVRKDADQKPFNWGKKTHPLNSKFTIYNTILVTLLCLSYIHVNEKSGYFMSTSYIEFVPKL